MLGDGAAAVPGLPLPPAHRAFLRFSRPHPASQGAWPGLLKRGAAIACQAGVGAAALSARRLSSLTRCRCSRRCSGRELLLVEPSNEKAIRDRARYPTLKLLSIDANPACT